MGWKVCLWARLLDGNHALKLIKNQLKLKPSTATIRDQDGGTYANMFDAHPPFQIDGNFGCTAGIAEMLVQSHDGTVHLLPALPDEWQEGEVSGLCTRGGFVIERMNWKQGRLVSVTIRSVLGGNLRLRTQQKLKLQSVAADGSASSASKKASRLKQAKGDNPNPLMQAYEMPAPVVKDASRLLPLSLAPTHCYDLMTQAGTLITLVP